MNAEPAPAAARDQANTLAVLRTAAVRAGRGADLQPDLPPDLPADFGARELIVATGADRIRFLHGIVTGNVAGTPVGGGGRSALLTPKGHVVADMRIFVRAGEVWIVVAPGLAAPTAEALSRYAIMDD